MLFEVDDKLEDLRFKTAAAIEYNRPLDFTIQGAGAQVLVQSIERVPVHDQAIAGGLVVHLVMPNHYRLEKLVIPDGTTAHATADTYSSSETE